MITRLEAIRYRCFERLAVDLTDFQVIVGANGAGKSTLLDLPFLVGELLRADTIALIFLVKRGDKPARAATLRELIYAGRGDDCAIALEAKLPDEIRDQWVEALALRTSANGEADALRDTPARWPTHIRYELRLEVVNERDLQVRSEYLFVFPEQGRPDRSVVGIWGESNSGQADRHFILRREAGGPAVFETETDIQPGSLTTRVKPSLLAMSAVKYSPDSYPAAYWLYGLLTARSVFLDPQWDRLRAPSPPGLEKGVIPSALNLPWLALDLKLDGLPDGASAAERAAYRSQDYSDWVDHVKTALVPVADIEIKEREEDHYAYFIIRYVSGYSVTSSGLSDGTLRILTLTLLPYLHNPPKLLVTEEPENGIHPRAIEAILQSLSSLYDSQVWVSSYSTVVLASCSRSQLLCARQTSSSGGVEVVGGHEHPRLRDWQGGIDLGSLFAAGVLA
ncbi:AAA family ATPase [uncultured Thiodictyon sp.]|jgi:predicted ATPase|uniref:methylation-associated defense system AAA family ATPase MAD3 n=1 Tax=uncultured Thiodictyon sp. TaxID=1846217 RepID=UPI0025F9CB41|nr:AAA family ATPase [uncultured Thiodictyon sp.]